MIKSWIQVAFQETPQTETPWIVMRVTFSDFNGTFTHYVLSTWRTQEEANAEKTVCEKLL